MNAGKSKSYLEPEQRALGQIPYLSLPPRTDVHDLPAMPFPPNEVALNLYRGFQSTDS